jgi:hypothetical protein
VWWWRELKEANKPQSAEIYKNGTENRRFPALFGLKIPKNAVFCSKVLHKIYYQDVFLRNTLIKKKFLTYGIVELYLFKVLGVIYSPSHPD